MDTQDVSIDNSFSRVLATRHNNLNLIRLIAACMVIFSHSFSVCEGALSKGTFLDVLTDNRLSWGGCAVGIFFFFSGILIAKSCETHPCWTSFFRKRVARIFPELIVAVVGCICILGPLVTRLGIYEYFTTPATYAYLLNIALIPTHPLPGVFESNPYPIVVNAALWTLPAEFVCYCLTFCMFLLTKFQPKKVGYVSSAIFALACAYFFCTSHPLLSAVRAMLLFYIGVCVWVYREKIELSSAMGMVSVVLFFGACVLGWDIFAMLVIFPYAMLYLGWGTRKKFDTFSAHQDYSYGMFLWGFPVQQTLIHYCSMLWWINTIMSIGIAWCLAWVSTHVMRGISTRMHEMRLWQKRAS